MIGVGLLFERKGIYDFIEVVCIMLNVIFIWFGNLFKFVIMYFIRKCIKNKFKNMIMLGYVDGVVIKGVFSGVDCVFFLSYEEIEGIVVLEGLVSKIFVVLCDIFVYYDWLFYKEYVLKGYNNFEFSKLIEKVLYED